MRAQSTRRDPSSFLLASAHAAALWTFVFAGMSFYWALGGGFLYRTQSPQILKLTAQPWFLVVWFTGLLKLIAGLLALVQRWDERVPGWFCRVSSWGIGLVLTLYGGANLAVRGLMALGALETSAAMHSTAARWHLVLWDPWFRRCAVSSSGVGV